MFPNQRINPRGKQTVTKHVTSSQFSAFENQDPPSHSSKNISHYWLIRTPREQMRLVFLLFLVAKLPRFANGASVSAFHLSWPEDCGEDALENALLGEYFHDSIIGVAEKESVISGDEKADNLRGRSNSVHRRLPRCVGRWGNKKAKRKYCGRRDRRLQLQLPENNSSDEGLFQEEEAHRIVEIMLAKCIEMNDEQCECALKKYWLTFD